jgi:hypothetical protein
MNKNTYPKSLFTQEIGMSAPAPKSPRNKPSFRIFLGPSNSGTRPIVFIMFKPVVLESLERVLLIVRCKFKNEC